MFSRRLRSEWLISQRANGERASPGKHQAIGESSDAPFPKCASLRARFLTKKPRPMCQLIPCASLGKPFRRWLIISLCPSQTWTLRGARWRVSALISVNHRQVHPSLLSVATNGCPVLDLRPINTVALIYEFSNSSSNLQPENTSSHPGLIDLLVSINLRSTSSLLALSIVKNEYPLLDLRTINTVALIREFSCSSFTLRPEYTSSYYGLIE